MDNVANGLIIVVGVVAVLLVLAFIWETGRSAYFAIAAKWYGWSAEEKRERLIARERRIWARDEREAKRDQAAAGDVTRKRYGVIIVAFAIFYMAIALGLPWWEAALAGMAVAVGLTMAAGLSFKW